MPPPESDRRDLEFVTIDPAGSLDLDQALHLERHHHGYLVHYAIADVPGFVRPAGAVDREARERGQTLYAADGRVPLHPAVLSEDRASLLPGVDRSAFVWTFELDDSDWGLFLLSLAGALIAIGTAAICFLKRRIGHGVAGLFFYPLSFYGAVRLAKPGSPWAKRYYGERNPRKQARAEKRFRHNRVERMYDAFRGAIGGSPTEPVEAKREGECFAVV